MVPQLPLKKRPIIEAVFGDKGVAYFWEARFLPRWLPLFLGLGLGILLALLIAKESWYFLVPAVLAVPAAVLFNRYPFAAVILWMLFLPYFLYEASTAGRAMFWILHRGMIPTALGLTVLSGLLGVRRRSIRLGRAEWTLLIFLGLAMVNILLLTRAYQSSAIALYDRLFVPFCMYVLVRLTAPRKRDLKRFLWVALITLVAQCVIGLLSWFVPQVVPSQWLNRQGARTSGTLRNVAVYTSTLLFVGLLLIQYAMNCRSKWIRYLILGLFGLDIFCVFFSFSRGSWVGCLIILVGLILLYPKMMIRFTIVLGVLIFILGSSILAKEIAFGIERLTSEEAEESADNRVIANAALFGMIKAKPFFGWGYDSYRLYQREFIIRVGNVQASLGYGINSHNTYLTMMAELGVIVFLLYMFPVGWWLRLSIRVWRRLPSHGFLSWRLLGILWMLMLHMFIVCNFLDMNRLSFGVTVWWMALGLIANLIYPYLKPGDIGAPSWARRPASLAR